MRWPNLSQSLYGMDMVSHRIESVTQVQSQTHQIQKKLHQHTWRPVCTCVCLYVADPKNSSSIPKAKHTTELSSARRCRILCTFPLYYIHQPTHMITVFYAVLLHNRIRLRICADKEASHQTSKRKQNTHEYRIFFCCCSMRCVFNAPTQCRFSYFPRNKYRGTKCDRSTSHDKVERESLANQIPQSIWSVFFLTWPSFNGSTHDGHHPWRIFLSCLWLKKKQKMKRFMDSMKCALFFMYLALGMNQFFLLRTHFFKCTTSRYCYFINVVLSRN